MDDRELLEGAARAAGIKIDKSPYNGGGRGNAGFDAMGNAVLDWHNGVTWNPLTDDGDALRLAVKLHILVDPDGHEYAYATAAKNGTVSEPHDGDPYAATRRAIVRAAAEIGKKAAPRNSG